MQLPVCSPLFKVSFTYNYPQSPKELSQQQIDIKETENRRLKVQESWLGPDLQEIQKLNDQLAEQKQELQSLIAQQAEEIEELNVQIQELRAEIDRLNRNLDEEKRAKQRTFQDQL